MIMPTSHSLRRRSSTLERVTEPNVLFTYLCGYSLRTCTLFILWIDIIVMITFFVMAILISSLMHFYIITQHHRNETKYTFSLNNEQILTIDLHGRISTKTSIEFAEIGKRFLQLLLSSAFVYFFVALYGLIGVYHDTLEYIIPYMVLLLTAVLWSASFIFLDVLLISCQYIRLIWWILLSAILYFLSKLYKLMVLYSYYYHYSGFAKDQMKTPPHLTTESPMQLPVTPVAETQVFKKNVKSEKSLQIEENRDITNQ